MIPLGHYTQMYSDPYRLLTIAPFDPYARLLSVRAFIPQLRKSVHYGHCTRHLVEPHDPSSEDQGSGIGP